MTTQELRDFNLLHRKSFFSRQEFESAFSNFNFKTFDVIITALINTLISKILSTLDFTSKKSTIDTTNIITDDTIDTTSIIIDNTNDTTSIITDDTTNTMSIITDDTIDTTSTITDDTTDTTSIITDDTIDTTSIITDDLTDTMSTITDDTTDTTSTITDDTTDTTNTITDNTTDTTDTTSTITDDTTNTIDTTSTITDDTTDTTDTTSTITDVTIDTTNTTSIITDDIIEDFDIIDDIIDEITEEDDITRYTNTKSFAFKRRRHNTNDEANFDCRDFDVAWKTNLKKHDNQTYNEREILLLFFSMMYANWEICEIHHEMLKIVFDLENYEQRWIINLKLICIWRNRWDMIEIQTRHRLWFE